MKRKRKIKFLLRKVYRMKTIPDIQIINGVISFRSDILGGKKDKESPPYVSIGWNGNPQFIAICHVRKSIRYGLTATSAEIYKLRLDKHFVDKLKRLRVDIMINEKPDVINVETRLYEKEKEDKIFS